MDTPTPAPTCAHVWVRQMIQMPGYQKPGASRCEKCGAWFGDLATTGVTTTMGTQLPAPAPAVSGQTPTAACEIHHFDHTVCPVRCRICGLDWPKSAPVASAPKDETKEDVQSRVDGE